ncbi:MAG: hypothetical protein ACRCYR_10360 [Phycicoccus sp.]
MPLPWLQLELLTRDAAHREQPGLDVGGARALGERDAPDGAVDDEDVPSRQHPPGDGAG